MNTSENLAMNNQSSIDSQSKKDSLPLVNVDVNILLEQNYKYYLEYMKIVETNRILKTELSCRIKEKNDLKQMIARLERRNKKLFLYCFY